MTPIGELRFGAEPPSDEQAERMLEASTALVLEARERNTGLAALDLEGELERLEHGWLRFGGLRLHLERHDVEAIGPILEWLDATLEREPAGSAVDG